MIQHEYAAVPFDVMLPSDAPLAAARAPRFQADEIEHGEARVGPNNLRSTT
jgi:hypothetical protein